jgi:methyltransferase-like protein 6
VGNTVYPLLEINPQAFLYACDFAPTAVDLLLAHPQFAASGHVAAFVADITGGWFGAVGVSTA